MAGKNDIDGIQSSLVFPTEIRGAGQIPALDGLRGVAIGLVLLHHCFGPAFSFFWIGVDLFFVLSGFLITRILLETRTAQHYFLNFFSRRMLRIFPLYYAVLILLFLILPHIVPVFTAQLDVLFDKQVWYWTYSENWLHVKQGWLPGKSMLLTHFWSLAIEEQYYLFWPFIVFLFPVKRLEVVIGILVSIAVALRFSGYFQNPGYYVATLTRMDSLLIGSLTAVLVRRGVAVSAVRILVLMCACILACGTGVLVFRSAEYSNPFMHTIGYTLEAIIFASVILLVTGGKWLWLKKHFLEFSGMRLLGKYSYGIYIFHFPVYWIMMDTGRSWLSSHFHNTNMVRIMISGGTITITFALALLSFHLLEQPFLRLKKYFA